MRAKQGGGAQGPRELPLPAELPGAVNAAQLGGGDLVGLALAARWARASRDGDMTGGDFPAWLPTLFAVGPAAQASAGQPGRPARRVRARRLPALPRLLHRKGDPRLAPRRPGHRQPRPGDDPGGLRRRPHRPRPDRPTSRPRTLKRIVFDEGHHLFDAADAPSPPCLSGAEAAEMRRWIRGPEGRGRRGRGLEARLGELVGEREDARDGAARRRVRAAAALPGEGWSGRIAPPVGEVSPIGPIEALPGRGARAAARPRRRLGARHGVRRAAGAGPGARDRGGGGRGRWRRSRRRCWRWRAGSADVLDEEADELATGERARIEGALRGLDRRARMMLPAWRSMLTRASTRTPRTIPTSSTGSTPPSSTAGWSTPPAAATGSTRPSRWPPRCWRRRTACW